MYMNGGIISMKKNLRIVSAAAAALLSVAPVVTSSISTVSADVISGGNLAGQGSTDPVTKWSLEFNTNLQTVPMNTNLKDFLKGTNVKKFISVKSSDDDAPVVSDVDAARISDQAIGGTEQTKLTAGKTYYLQAWVNVTGLHKGQQYSATNASFDKDAGKTSNVGELDNVKIAIPFTAVDPAAKGTPHFATANNQVFKDGAQINASETIPVNDKTFKATPADSAENIAKIINGMNIKFFADNTISPDKAVAVKVTAADVQKQLDKAGINITDKDGKVTIPAKGFTYTISQANPNNGKTTSLKVFFKASVPDTTTTKNGDLAQTNANSPLIKFNGVNVAQGTDTFNQSPVALVKLGDTDWQGTILKHFVAQKSASDNTAITITKADLAGTVDTKEPGVYPVTLTVTGENKTKTVLHFNVGVTGSKLDQVSTKTILHNTNFVSLDGNHDIVLPNQYATAGQQLMVYNDTKKVGDSTYARVFIQGTEREKTNVWVNTDAFTDIEKSSKTVMHAAATYDAEGKDTGAKLIGAYSKVNVENRIYTIKGQRYYKMDANRYIKVGNIDGTQRRVKHNAYVYNNKGKARHISRHKIQRVDKDLVVTTYGARFNIHGHDMYRVGVNQYIKVANF